MNEEEEEISGGFDRKQGNRESGGGSFTKPISEIQRSYRLLIKTRTLDRMKITNLHRSPLAVRQDEGTPGRSSWEEVGKSVGLR
ncbi:hypothetical protein L2E82_45955 [Cichorium intybus]|uniref:Uncharacterized protein n=2 Tax=Cichorium intybus TaxID=13427 RepID=A0ACB8ZUA5_CICIN|nr:hypothetical protein L2E82_45954 [Cichorium intybus]KAI3701301.1 hypothetical protein L2E82_45955 [Cichorium intybus]